MQQGEEGDLSLPISEQDDIAKEGLNVSQVDSEPKSPLEGDLGSGFKSENQEITNLPSEEKSSVQIEEDKENGANPIPSIEEGLKEDKAVTDEVSSQKAEEDRDSDVKNHQRNDSVPLKRYDIENATTHSHIPSYLLTEAEETSDGIHDSGYALQTQRHISSFSETEDAGLDFVDVTLDRDVNPRSPYGPGAFHASRSAVEIRQDSMSSDSEASRKAAKEAEEKDRQASEQYLQRRGRSTSDGESSKSSHSSRTTGRSVEGRYMGRVSRPTSRATSPEPNGAHLYASNSHSSSLSLTVPQANDDSAAADTSIGGGGGGFTMVVAGEDGEINIVPTSERALTTPTEIEEERKSPVDLASEKETEQKDSSQVEGAEAGNESLDIKEITTSSAPADEADESAATPKMASADSNNSLNDAADREKGKRRRESSNKPSALEQHVSRTRMTNLPPKPKQEDTKHLHDFEVIMKMSKELEQKKQQEIEDKKRQKDVELQENMKIWEKDILPSWTRARREVKLRKLWWKGIPSSIRGRLWALACGNNQMLPRNLFSKASAEAAKSREEGTFPSGDLRAMESDIADTLPSLKLFQKETGALYEDLFSVLSAFVVVRMDQVELRKGKEERKERQSREGEENVVHVYQEGAASLAAMLLTNLSPSETLIALLNLIAERPWLRALYAPSKGEKQDPAAGFERVFDTLLADQMPKVYANMQARGVRPSAYVTRWVRTLFVPHLPFDLVARLWDCILLDEGDALIFRSGIALVSLLSARLYVPDKAELISILRGNNRAALSVWYRIRNETANGPLSPSALSPGRGGEENQEIHKHLSIEAPIDFVPLDNIYGGQYDINETNFFQALDEQGTWWKNSTLERLLDRELVA